MTDVMPFPLVVHAAESLHLRELTEEEGELVSGGFSFANDSLGGGCTTCGTTSDSFPK